GVNIDHVATVREARGTIEPDPVWAASICELAGCDSIVVHLREDRRHIHDRDVRILRQTVRTRLNLEMSIAKSIVDIACKVAPDQSTLVPEKRQELTTEGGLDVKKHMSAVQKAADRLRRKGIRVSLFIDPERSQIEATKRIGVDMIELHTGCYANMRSEKAAQKELMKLIEAADFAGQMGIAVNAGHGLTYQNVKPVAGIVGVEELNIGHSIISRAVLVGLDKAVREMRALIQ
ncbi:MAG: pyridoxine 5'-phosphate synthase, partial [Candidatus Omnitrophota bacterium]